MTSQPISRAELRRAQEARRTAGAARAGRGHRHRQGRGRGLIVLVLALTLLVAAGSGSWFAYRARQAVVCGDQAVRLRVVAAPEVASAVRVAASSYSRTGPVVERACVKVDVQSTSAADVSTRLTDAARTGTDPGLDAWVTDSALWAKALSRRPEVDRLLPDVFSVLATTPVVAAVPEPQAKALGWPGKAITLEDLIAAAEDGRGWGAVGHPEWGQVKVAWAAPATSSAGLGGLMTLFARFDRDATTAGDPTAVRAGMLQVQNALVDLDADPQNLLSPLTDASLSADQALRKAVIAPSTGREVGTFNAGKPRVRLAAVRVGTIGSQTKVGYLPVYGSSDDRSRKDQAARGFGDYLETAKGGAPFAERGWDIPTVPLSAVARRVDSPTPAPIVNPRLEGSSPTISSISQALQSWSALQRKGAVLLTVDVSGSMRERIPKSPLTRLDLAKRALTTAVTSFSDRSSLGLWVFSRQLDGNRDYREVVRLGKSADPVGAGSRRQAVLAGIDGLTAGGDTGLYDTTLPAVREARRRWTPGSNVVVILSDGRNDDPGSASLSEVVSRLRSEQDPERPVQVYTIAYGAQADASALRAIATATGGASFTATNPADLQRVLLLSLTS
jgi:Ca-activated chloride channel homolog